jgi:hypothetical protein
VPDDESHPDALRLFNGHWHRLGFDVLPNRFFGGRDVLGKRRLKSAAKISQKPVRVFGVVCGFHFGF